MASKEPPRFPPGPGSVAISKVAQALVDIIQRSPLGETQFPDQQTFESVFGPGEAPTLGQLAEILTPAQDPHTAPLDFIPGSLFGLGRRARRGPFFHGTKEARVENVLDKGFIEGRSAELDLPGTSLTRDPLVSQEMFAENELADLILGVDVPEDLLKEIRNLSPSEFLRSAEILEELNLPNFPTATNKPGVFMRETESFFPRTDSPGTELVPRPGKNPVRIVTTEHSGPASRLKPREMSQDEELLQEFQDVVENRGAKKRPEKLKTSQVLSGKGGVSEARLSKDLAAQLRGPKSQVDRNVGRAIEMMDDIATHQPLMGPRLDFDRVNGMRERLQGVENSFRDIQATGRMVDDMNSAVKKFRTRVGGGVRLTQRNATVETVDQTVKHLGILPSTTRTVDVRFHPHSRFQGPDDSTRLVSFRIPSTVRVKKGDTLQSLLDQTRAPVDDMTRGAQQELQAIIKQLETGKLAPPPVSENRLQRVREIMERDTR